MNCKFRLGDQLLSLVTFIILVASLVIPSNLANDVVRLVLGIMLFLTFPIGGLLNNWQRRQETIEERQARSSPN